jgi:hypothetical protein
MATIIKQGIEALEFGRKAMIKAQSNTGINRGKNGVRYLKSKSKRQKKNSIQLTFIFYTRTKTVSYLD